VADTGKGRPAPAQDTPVAEGHKEPFALRWSRLKQEARERPVEKAPPAPAAADPKAPPPELPPPDKLTFDSDYRQFFHPKVSEDVRRAALKKLFNDPRFNVMDGLDVYIDDYSKTEPIPAAMLAGLKQAQNILRWAKEDEDERRKQAEAREEKPPQAADAGRAPLDPPAVQSVPGAEPGASVPRPAVTAPESAPVSASDAGGPTRA
jgi:hypothetical protein